MESEKRLLSAIQITALQRARKIVDDLEENKKDKIVSLYRMGRSQREIAELTIPEEVLIGRTTAKHAVFLVIRDLISEEERMSLERQHERLGGLIGGSKGGRRAYLEGKGAFSISRQRRTEIASAAGLRSSTLLRQQGRGIFGLTPDQRREALRRSFETTGHRAFSDAEMIMLLGCTNDSAYQHSRGSWKGHPDFGRIQKALELQFGIARTRAVLRETLRIFFKKALGEKKS